MLPEKNIHIIWNEKTKKRETGNIMRPIKIFYFLSIKYKKYKNFDKIFLTT